METNFNKQAEQNNSLADTDKKVTFDSGYWGVEMPDTFNVDYIHKKMQEFKAIITELNPMNVDLACDNPKTEYGVTAFFDERNKKMYFKSILASDYRIT
jgi:hypothetical protein